MQAHPALLAPRARLATHGATRHHDARRNDAGDVPRKDRCTWIAAHGSLHMDRCTWIAAQCAAQE